MGAKKGRVVYERQQKTLKEAIRFSGIGLHTGEVVEMGLFPSPENSGMVISRKDIGGSPHFQVDITAVGEATDRCTAVGEGRLRVYTVEHLLAALYANEIDNVLIELTSLEPPIATGGADTFVELILKAGSVALAAPRKTLILEEPIYWSAGDKHLVALPHSHYQVSYTVSYPDCEVLRAQYKSTPIDADIFNKELAPCRTFCHYKEIEALMERGLIKGGSLDNAVVIHEGAVLSKNGLAFPDEMVRHKILDLVGDLALVGCDLKAHIIALRAGHEGHCAIARLLYNTITE